jgi:hypothetical protein
LAELIESEKGYTILLINFEPKMSSFLDITNSKRGRDDTDFFIQKIFSGNEQIVVKRDPNCRIVSILILQRENYATGIPSTSLGAYCDRHDKFEIVATEYESYPGDLRVIQFVYNQFLKEIRSVGSVTSKAIHTNMGELFHNLHEDMLYSIKRLKKG